MSLPIATVEKGEYRMERHPSTKGTSAPSDVETTISDATVNTVACAKVKNFPCRVRLHVGRKQHDLIIDDWADLLDMAQLCHAAIFFIDGQLILAEMAWDRRFWGTA